MKEIELSKDSRLRTTRYWEGIKLTRLRAWVNGDGDLEIQMLSQKTSQTPNALVICKEDLPRFREILQGWKLRGRK